LLLDDDPALRKLLRRLLKTGGYEVREASDSDAAIAELRGRKIDLVVVNLNTGDEGKQAAQVLRSVCPELVIIVLSETVGLAETSERVLILPKPSRPFAVIQSIRQVLTKAS
jgi:DNA-binding response OmpR family regulator